MVGSVDYADTSIQGQVNVVTAPRQPGSTFKPYVYATAMENGLNPGSILLDAQTTFEGNYTPKNFSGKFSGPVSLRYALQNSLNIPAIKAAILSSDSATPNGNQGINQVFDLTLRAGMSYPCIPSADGAKCKDDQTASKAFRDRCGLSSALGGCEVTMLSHLTSLNTFAQDGNLRTATPFKEIRNAQGIDIYAQKQNSSNPVYPKQDNAINPLTARQINSVLSDYEARKPIFGNASRLLELPGWTGENSVAAKTGTTNNNKDMWTVGYTPYYSVAIWAGNTDGKLMNANASSTATTSTAWQKMMVYLHKDKTKTGFSKQGLVATNLDPATGLISEGGRNEWLTPAQKQLLEQAQQKLNQNDYKPAENNFLSNATTVVSRKLKINKLDGKLATDKTLPENIEEQTFLEVVAEYPIWIETAKQYMQSAGDRFKPAPTEISDQDQVAEQQKVPTITSSLDQSTKNISSIEAQAQAQGNGNKQISSIEILINGTVKASNQNQNSLKLNDLKEFAGKTVTVLIRAKDSANLEVSKTYQNVTIESTSSVDQDLSSTEIRQLQINCAANQSSTNADCTFNLQDGKTLPSGFKIRIGTSGDGKSCSTKDLKVSCSNIPIQSSTSQNISLKIQAFLDGDWLNTAKDFTLPTSSSGSSSSSSSSGSSSGNKQP